MKSLPLTAYLVAYEKVGDRELRMTERQYQMHVRWRFIEALRSFPYFQALVVRDLRPLWRQLSGVAQTIHLFNQLPPRSPYVIAVNDLVSQRMNCREDGQPAGWVAQEVHHAVIGVRLPAVEYEHVGWMRTSLQVSANTIGSARVDKVQHTRDGDETLSSVPVNGPQFTAFDEWEELRRVAHAQLDELIDVLERTYNTETSDVFTKTTRPSKLQSLSGEGNMRKLIAWLWTEAGARSGLTRDMRTRLLRELGLDQVSRAKTQKR